MSSAQTPTPSADPLFQQALEKAKAYFQSKKFDACRATLNDLIAEAPDYAEAHNLLGYLHQATGDLDAAVESFRRTIALMPNAPGAHNNLAAVLAQSGEFDSAIAAYEDALRLAPTSAAIHYNKATALAAKNRPSEAIDAFTKTLTFDPRYRDADQRLAKILSKLDAPPYLSLVEAALIRCFESTRVDYVPLARPAARQLMLKYGLVDGFEP